LQRIACALQFAALPPANLNAANFLENNRRAGSAPSSGGTLPEGRLQSMLITSQWSWLAAERSVRLRTDGDVPPSTWC
jgi:hypothetical protein